MHVLVGGVTTNVRGVPWIGSLVRQGVTTKVRGVPWIW